MLRCFMVIVTLSCALFAPTAEACSVSSDYVVPSNFELVQIADAIVVATPLSQVDERNDPSVRFRVDDVIKGDPPRELTLFSMNLGDVELSDPTRLIGVNSDAMSGGCIRRTFRPGQQAVLFLHRGEAGWSMLGFPFARVNEDYFGPSALWPRTVRQYLDIQSRDAPMQQLAVLERLLTTELAHPQSDEQRERARDILSHLMSRSEWKPTRYLIETYEALERGETPRYSFRPRAADQEQSQAQALTVLLFGDNTQPVTTVTEQQRFVLASLEQGDHPDAAPLFERIAAAEPQAWQLGMAIRFFARNGQYRRAYGMIENEAMRTLVRLPRDEARQLIQDIILAIGDTYDEGHERWRSDPYVAAHWPELAFALRRYEVQTFGRDNAHGFGNELTAIPLTDFRARPDLAMARAEAYDDEVEAWARAQLSDEAQRVAWERLSSRTRGETEDPALLPLRVTMLSYGDERDAMLERVYCQSADRRMLLIDVLGELGDDLDEELASRIAADRTLTDEEREAIARATARLYARAAENSHRGSWLWGEGDSEFQLLGQILRRERIEATPMSCAGR